MIDVELARMLGHEPARLAAITLVALVRPRGAVVARLTAPGREVGSIWVTDRGRLGVRRRGVLAARAAPPALPSPDPPAEVRLRPRRSPARTGLGLSRGRLEP